MDFREVQSTTGEVASQLQCKSENRRTGLSSEGVIQSLPLYILHLGSKHTTAQRGARYYAALRLREHRQLIRGLSKSQGNRLFVLIYEHVTQHARACSAA